MARKRNQAFKTFALFVILPLMVIDAYAYWKVHQASQNVISNAFSLSEPLDQLAVILGINIAVIIVLMAYIGGRGR